MCLSVCPHVSNRVCLCLSVLPSCFLQSCSHSITQYCAKGYSSTKAFSFAITSSSLFFPLSVSASISLFNVSVCLSLPLLLFLSLSLFIAEISAISADCHIMCVCLLACLLVYDSKVRYVPKEVKWVLWPCVLVSSWTELHAFVGRGHSCRVKLALIEDLVSS